MSADVSAVEKEDSPPMRYALRPKGQVGFKYPNPTIATSAQK